MSMFKGYYNEPEGQDAFGKVVATNKIAVAIGLPWSAVDVLMITKTQGYLPTIGRIAYNVGPLMGMATAFTLATYSATKLRGKDDRFNYFLGGLAAGGIFGCCKRSVVSGLTTGLFLGIAGILKKLSIQEGWEFFPDLETHPLGTLNSVTHDYTITAERPRNWTNKREE